MRKQIHTGVKVGDIMTRSYIHCSPTMDLEKAARLMVKKRVGSLLIAESDLLKGILTEKDIIWAVLKKGSRHLRDIKVKDLMKRKVITIKPSADITEALDKMRKKKVRRLPVLENKKLIGMLTMNDILRIDPGLFQLIAETVQIKEESEKIKTGKTKMINKPGICEECGQYGILYQDADMRLCEDCVES